MKFLGMKCVNCRVGDNNWQCFHELMSIHLMQSLCRCGSSFSRGGIKHKACLILFVRCFHFAREFCANSRPALQPKFSCPREFCANTRLALKSDVFPLCARHSYLTTCTAVFSISLFVQEMFMCFVSRLRSSWLVCGRTLMTLEEEERDGGIDVVGLGHLDLGTSMETHICLDRRSCLDLTMSMET